MKEESKTRVTRRSFLKSTGGALALTSVGAGMSFGLAGQADGATNTKSGNGKTMKKRVLGKTGEKLSIIGFGGIVVCGTE